MMNRYGLIILLGFLCSFVKAMDDCTFEFIQATSHDLSQLVELMNEEGYLEDNAIVVPPKRFREAYFKGAIERNELYVIKYGSKVVGYKKLFLMDDAARKRDILENEIRCMGERSESQMKGAISVCNSIVSFEPFLDDQLVFDRPVFIYNGGDFTKKAYRGQGLNKLLMQKALDSIKEKTKEMVYATDSEAITMVYGITGSNGAFAPGSASDRTRPIVKTFVPFARNIADELQKSKKDKDVVQHERFKAFKPSFDPDAQEFKPLADEFSVPGAGVVLSYSLSE